LTLSVVPAQCLGYTAKNCWRPKRTGFSCYSTLRR